MAEAPGVTDSAAAELERQRALARARQQKRRSSLKVLAGGAPVVAAADRQPSVPSASTHSPAVHSTQRLESLGTTPDAFTGIPPATDAPPELVVTPDADAIAGAKKFAAVIGWMVDLALADASERYGAEGLAAHLPVSVGAAELVALRGQAVEYVKARAESCALKHGIKLHIPYEDEVVTVGAGAASGVYLLRKFTGRLPDPSKPPPSRTEDTGAPPSHDDAGDDTAASTISLGGAGDGEGFPWLRR